MSLKRARLLEQASFSVEDTAEREDAEYRKEAGVKFRKYLLERYTTGAATAADTCTLAHYHTESGGLGTEDLGLHPDQATVHGARHLRFLGLSLAVFACSVFGVLAWQCCCLSVLWFRLYSQLKAFLLARRLTSAECWSDRFM